MRPRLVVVAPDALAVVRFAGGWLFDQTMCGWDVAVVCPHDDGGIRPLRILGARCLDSRFVTRPDAADWPEAMAVERGMYRQEEGARRMVAEAAAGGSDIRFWDVDAHDASTAAIRHELSLAAQAFKAQALKAAAEPVDSLDCFEHFSSDEPLLVPDHVPS